MGNSYLDKKNAKEQALLHIGEEIGRQQVTDMFVSILKDYSIMGNKKLRPEEIAKVVDESSRRLSQYWEAWTGSVEADYQQEMLDRDIKEGVPADRFAPFRDRYPYLKDYDYKKGKWK